MRSPALTLREGPDSLPRGPHRLPEEQVVASQRGRILHAIAEVVAEKGYQTATVAHISARARVSRSAFYALYADKEDAYLEAYVRISDQHRAVVDAAGSDGDWRERLSASLRAYLEALVSAPDYAWAFMLEVRGAGPRAREARAGVLGGWVDHLAEIHAEAAASLRVRPAGRAMLLAVVGGADDLVCEYVRSRRLGELMELHDVLLELHLRVLAAPSA